MIQKCCMSVGYVTVRMQQLWITSVEAKSLLLIIPSANCLWDVWKVIIRAGLNMPDEVKYVCVNQSLQSLEGYLFANNFKMKL